jgi:hypothetical protein
VAPESPLDRLSNVAAGAVGAVGLVYVVGGLSLSLRYDGLGLPGQESAAVTPREMLLAAGLRTMVIWGILGFAVALALAAGGKRVARAIDPRRRRPVGATAVAALALGLLFVHVVWPLVTLVAVLFTTYATVHWEAWRRLGVTALAVGAVAVAYEADRITYQVESTCVNLKEPVGRPCGVLVGQQDRGFYLGVSEGSATKGLLFVPTSRVSSASSHKKLEDVTVNHGHSRRETIVSRVGNIDIR